MKAWLEGREMLPIFDPVSVSAAREAVRAEGERAGLGKLEIETMALVVSELATNQLVHAGGGVLVVFAIRRDGVPGLEVIAVDHGPGIADPGCAFRGPAVEPVRGSLQAGLRGVRRMADEMDVDVRLGEGSCLRARKFAEPPGRRREVGIFGRPLPGELTSGDDAGFVRDGDRLVVGVADGLGHGEAAREASERAVQALYEGRAGAPSDILEAAHRAALGTRGAMMAVVALDERLDVAVHAAAGDVSTHLQRRRKTHHFLGTARTLGRFEPRPRRCASEEVGLEPGDVLVMFSDGLVSRTSLEEEPGLQREHPIVIAHHLLASFARETDDATVLVVR